MITSYFDYLTKLLTSMENQNPTKQSHYLLLTLPTQGHTNPTLEFANRLLNAGSLVTFATTSSSYKLINDSVPPTGAGTCSGIGLSSAVFSEDGDCREDSLAAIFTKSADQGNPITHMVHTNLLAWTVRVAQRFNVPSTLLWVGSASVLVIYFHYFNGYRELVQDCEKNPSWSISLPSLPYPLKTQDLPAYLLPSSLHGVYVIPRFQEQVEELKKDGKPIQILVNTAEALEGYTLRSLLPPQCQLTAVGPLIPSSRSEFKDDDDHMKWLSSQEKSSVIYVALGSFWVLPKEQMEEMARALILTERPFLWVVRGYNDNDNDDNCLGSFKEGLKKQGLIVPWCTQPKVMSHPSIGCFLTHCGWNSILESVIYGIPMVAFPLSSDQMTNAKMVEDVWRVGVRVKVDEEVGLVKSQEIKRCLEFVMEDQLVKGNVQILSNNVKECGISNQNIKAFIEHTNVITA